MSDENDRPLGAKVARDGIPALRAEALRMAGALADSAAQVRLYQTKIDAVLAALSPDFATLPAASCSTEIAISLLPDAFDTTSDLISCMQDHSQHLTIDDCLNKIFIKGLATLAPQFLPPPLKGLS